MEYHKPMKAFQVIRFCDGKDCSGEMRVTGKVQFSHPVRYEHHCSVCENIGYFEKSYPFIDFKEDIK